ncbi:palmitoyl-monogalactosyldiacylglycerol delta-7 desaturase chloroplastic-like [Prunus yedoensis var. nudiflora]|uniref:Palmitoyl-monogalactosyldiacylglycerol delta-7 desaturase chloroplastic-like n=1 Tax=Prunus yedoensis var. nudiflora TaxID=2094558 RepID=A0A314UDL2_PRUYE|nr:palmitoyl-monogalactosyldiacylglycerol delta-7 desaturase chloroplastic-like [Prunus yedoensis var. nudiflora]
MGLLGMLFMKSCGEFWGRTWNIQDVFTLAVILALHSLCAFAPFHFNWPAFWVAVTLYVVTGLGVTLCYHRSLTHRGLRIPKWLEYLFAYCGVLSLQGSPIEWVSNHRYHHQFTDTEKDPHSPIQSLWHSHIGWIFDTHRRRCEHLGGLKNVEELKKQPFYRFLFRTNFLHSFALGGLLYAVGGFPFLVWAVGVRTVLLFHATLIINSVGHMWGKKPWNTGDMSTNNWWLAIIMFGEGWHNNHHAFEYSARHGLEWWQIDFTWYTIRFLQAIGLATDVKVPTEIQKQRKATNGRIMATQN